MKSKNHESDIMMVNYDVTFRVWIFSGFGAHWKRDCDKIYKGVLKTLINIKDKVFCRFQLLNTFAKNSILMFNRVLNVAMPYTL